MAGSPQGQSIPEATVSRLPLYLRSLQELMDEQLATVSSERLAEMAGVNAAKVRKDLSYFGSYTVYHVELPSGRILKVSQNNTQRHRDHAITWGDQVWAHWSPTAQVVLTQ